MLANAKERASAQEGPPGNGGWCLCKAFLISMGSETTLDCLAADRAAVECPEYLSLRRQRMMNVENMRIPTAPGPASGLSAVLGGMPWDSRATAFKPDVFYLMQQTQKVKNQKE